MKRLYLLLFCLTAALAQQPPQAATVPYTPAIITDKKGGEWFIEQNGGLQRNSSGASMLGNCMMLQLGSQQFYSPQPMVTADGREIVMSSPQPMNGVSITRRINVLEREGGLRYVEEFTNTTTRDLTLTVEIRHGFNNQAKGFFSDTGRGFKDPLQLGESGILALPGTDDANAPAVLLTLCAPGVSTPPRVTLRNSYQVSVLHTLTLPAGQSAALVHGIAQIKLSPGVKPEEAAKACRFFAMPRLTRGLPKATLKMAVNLEVKTGSRGLAAWFPEALWGVVPESTDLLVLDASSRLRGRASARSAGMTCALGKVEVPWDSLAAVTGGQHSQERRSWLWLRDGQRWSGALDLPGLKFSLSSGADLELSNPPKLILAKPLEATPPPTTHALLELWSGDRIAFVVAGSFDCDTPWGRQTVAWADVVTLTAPESWTLGGLLQLQDGTRLRVMPVLGNVTLNTKSFGPQPFDLSQQMRHVITPLAAKMPEDDAEPAASFVDLSADQLLVGRVTTTLTLNTHEGSFPLAPNNIRELRDITEYDDVERGPRRFQADLWGGGSLTGSLRIGTLRVEGRGHAWEVPTRHLLRLVNPVPVTASALMRRIGQLIQELGNAEWKTRERASTELREMGALARGSLQEALKTATDAEVTRRLEELLAALD